MNARQAAAQWKPGRVTCPGNRTDGCGYRPSADRPTCTGTPRYRVKWRPRGSSLVCEYHAAECRARFVAQMESITSI